MYAVWLSSIFWFYPQRAHAKSVFFECNGSCLVVSNCFVVPQRVRAKPVQRHYAFDKRSEGVPELATYLKVKYPAKCMIFEEGGVVL